MNFFSGENFLLSGEAARSLYRGCAGLPVFDYHNHLPPQKLYENRPFRSLAEFWLAGDHYIWRAMRLAGLPERLITGGAPDEEKFLAWAGVLDSLVGCPLYDWTQMQLSFLFGETEPLSAANAGKVYARCNEKLQEEDFRPLALLKRFGVKALCTTDEPWDSLEWHALLQEEEKELLILPAFRPDKLLAVSEKSWLPAVKALEKSEGRPVRSLDALCLSLEHALDRFAALGCRTADQGYEGMRYTDPTGAEAVFDKALHGGAVTGTEAAAFGSFLLRFLGEKYADRGMVMQLRFGALRNANSRLYMALGPDCGGDCAGDGASVRSVVSLLDELESWNKLPKTILYSLDEGAYTALATVCAAFAGGGVRCRVQLGSAWWFLDHERGIRRHLNVLMENALLPGFVGMLTDSRSIGSFVRHDYFRRILCDAVGAEVDRGRFPLENAQRVVNNICYQNAKDFFGLPGR